MVILLRHYSPCFFYNDNGVNCLIVVISSNYDEHASLSHKYDCSHVGTTIYFTIKDEPYFIL